MTEAKPRSLTTVDEAKEILEIPLKEGGKVNRVVLIGVFTNLDVQDDELDDFLSYFKAHCRFSTRVYCAVVEGEGEVVDWLKSEGWFDRGPAAVLFRSKTDVVLGGSREDIVVETEQVRRSLGLLHWSLHSSYPPPLILGPFNRLTKIILNLGSNGPDQFFNLNMS